jgi:hypothetical protein
MLMSEPVRSVLSRDEIVTAIRALSTTATVLRGTEGSKPSLSVTKRSQEP